MILKLLIKLTGAHKPRIAKRKAQNGGNWFIAAHLEPPKKISEIPAALVNMYLNAKSLNHVYKLDYQRCQKAKKPFNPKERDYDET